MIMPDGQQRVFLTGQIIKIIFRSAGQCDSSLDAAGAEAAMFWTPTASLENRQE